MKAREHIPEHHSHQGATYSLQDILKVQQRLLYDAEGDKRIHNEQEKIGWIDHYARVLRETIERDTELQRLISSGKHEDLEQAVTILKEQLYH